MDLLDKREKKVFIILSIVVLIPYLMLIGLSINGVYHKNYGILGILIATTLVNLPMVVGIFVRRNK